MDENEEDLPSENDIVEACYAFCMENVCLLLISFVHI
jgi:hypothetical protein